MSRTFIMGVFLVGVKYVVCYLSCGGFFGFADGGE